MNATLKLIMNHRTVRAFSDKTVKEKTVKKIIDAGRHASTSMGQQAFSIIRVKDRKLRKEIGEITGQPYAETAPEWFLIAVDLYRNRQITEEQQEHFTGAGDFYIFEQAFMDAAIAAQNMALAAESMGLGICYFGSIFHQVERLTDLLRLPPLTFPVTGLGMGYPKQKSMRKPRLPEQVQVFTDCYKVPDDYLRVLKEYDSEMAEYTDVRHPETKVPPFTLQVVHRNTGTTAEGEAIQQLIRRQGFTWMKEEN